MVENIKLSNMPAYKLKSRKKFDDVTDVSTFKFLEEFSFLDRDPIGGLVKLPLEVLAEKQIKDKLSRLIDKLNIPIIELSTLQPKEIWEQSGRFEKFKNESIFSKDGRILFPTSEEPVVNYLSRNSMLSYRDLPILLFGFRKLFRSPRTKNIIRLSEFEIMDMYSVNENSESINQTIKNIIAPLFDNVWKTLNLNIVPVDKRDGYVDFKYATEEGDDRIPKTGRKCVSIGVIMNLGDTYSRAFNFSYSGDDEKKYHPHLGSYAIGIERLLYAIIHQNRGKVDNKPIIFWPYDIEPFTVGLIGVGKDSYEQKVYEELRSKRIRTIVDDTDDSIGVRIRRLYAIGTPFILFAGERERRKGIVGVEETYTGERYETKLNEFIKNVDANLKHITTIGRKT